MDSTYSQVSTSLFLCITVSTVFICEGSKKKRECDCKITRKDYGGSNEGRTGNSAVLYLFMAAHSSTHQGCSRVFESNNSAAFKVAFFVKHIIFN